MNKFDSQGIANDKKEPALLILITLALLSAFGPFVTDLYLPALPSLADYFETSASTVNLSLSLSMLGLALWQVFIGPLSGKYGRRKTAADMYVAFCNFYYCLFILLGYLLFYGVQTNSGIAGAGGVVLSKSIPTDMFSGKELVKYLAIISAINGIAPVVLPVLGGVILEKSLAFNSPLFVDWSNFVGSVLSPCKKR